MEPDQTKQKAPFGFIPAKVIVPIVVAFGAVIVFVIIMANTDHSSPSDSPSARKFATADQFATAWNQAAGWPDDVPLMHKLSLQLTSGCLAEKTGATPQQIVANADDIWPGITRRGSMTHDQFVELLTASTELSC